MNEEKNSKPIQNSHSKIASYLAAASSTAFQTTCTHFLDTVTKRLQNNKNVSLTHPTAFFKQLYSVIYPTQNSSMWDGFKAALTYRVTACTITLGSQPIVQRYIVEHHGHIIGQWTGEKYKTTVSHMISGAAFGVFEVIFLPLDKWKVLRQMNNTTPLYYLIQQEKSALYTGASITVIRNFKSFGVWFGVNDIVTQSLSIDGKPESLSFSQRLIASSTGAVAATIVSNPCDVIKTIKQTQTNHASAKKPLSTLGVAKQVLQENGVKGFARGLNPRLWSIVPRLTFLKAISDELNPLINEGLDKCLNMTKK